MNDLGTLLRWGSGVLAQAGITEPRWEARHLLAEASSLSSQDIHLYPERTCPHPEVFQDWIHRRAAGEPPARITGFAEFWGLRLEIGPETLDPRNDSECLVQEVLSRWPCTSEGTTTFADIGTGSGCLSIALLLERPNTQGYGVDISTTTLSVACRNAERHGCGKRFFAVKGTWTYALAPKSLDWLISNPPYIRRNVLEDLDAAVREYDPVAALDGGLDGLDAYRAILADSHRVLRPGGKLAFEIGWDQGESVLSLMKEYDLTAPHILQDLSGRDRVIVAGQRI